MHIHPPLATDHVQMNAINTRIPGWSGPAHYAFFLAAMQRLMYSCNHYRPINILVLGVYHGRDIAYMLDIARQMHDGDRFHITGVDKFDAAPCADWPEEKRGLTWEQAGFGPPPSLATAQQNLKHGEHQVKLIAMPDEQYLATHCERFDFIYVDTSHDYETVKRQLGQLPAHCAGMDAIIAGDDYSDEGTWGVKRAVTEAFGQYYSVFANWIWSAPASALAPAARLQVMNLKAA